MAEYRLYLMDRFTGHIDGVETLSSADDVGAICLVQERRGDAPMELWCGGRKIRRFEPAPDVAAPAWNAACE